MGDYTTSQIEDESVDFSLGEVKRRLKLYLELDGPIGFKVLASGFWVDRKSSAWYTPPANIIKNIYAWSA